MPSFTNYTRGTIVTAEKLNQYEKGLYWLQLDVLRNMMEDALRGLVVSHISLFYDLFNDTSEFDNAAVTPDMSIDTANGVIQLPGGFSLNTDYYYQSILHTFPATVTKANMLLLREDIANTNVYPSLSCVGSGAGASFVEKTTPIATRNVTSTLDQWTEDFATTGNSGAYTVEFSGGKIVLPGGAADPYATASRLTNDAVMQIDSDGGSTTNQPQVAVCWLPNGSYAIAYGSKEYNSSFINIRVRVVKTDGTFQTWGGVSYIDVTTASSDLHSGWLTKIACNAAGTKLGVLYRHSTDIKYARIDLTGGSVDTSFTVHASASHADMKREASTDNVWVSVMDGGGTTFRLYKFDMTSASGPGATAATGTMGGSYTAHMIDLDQEDDVHLLYHDGTNARYNIWDQSAGAWLYTFNSGDKTFADATTFAWKRDLKLVADKTQTASNKRAWAIYAKDNGSSKSAVFFRDITAGTVGSEVTVKTSATIDYRWLNAYHDRNSGVVQVLYCDVTSGAVGLLASSVTYAGSVGSESTIRSASTAAANAVAVKSDFTKAVIAFRDGADDNTASELYSSTKNLGYTTTAKTWQSVVYTVPTSATKFFVSSVQTTPSNTSVVWQISADNGGTWDTVTLGTTGTFTVPGTQIILRATLQSTDGVSTPDVDAVDWKTLLPLIEEEFEWTGLSGVDVKVKLRGRSSNASYNPKVHSLGVVVS